MSSSTAAHGALGGAAAELGSEYRARVGALLATALIRRDPLEDLGLRATGAAPTLLRAETDDPVDDLVLTLSGGARVFVQAKFKVGLTSDTASPFVAAFRQFAAAVQGGLADGDHLVLASAELSAPLRRLQTLLDRRRHAVGGNPAPAEAAAWQAVKHVATACGLTGEELNEVADRLVIWTTDPMSGDGEGMLVARLDGAVVLAGHGRAAARDLTDEVRMLARIRAGHDDVGFVRALVRRGHQLTPAAVPTSPVAWARALEAHRARAVREGTTLRLFDAPSELQDLPLEVADAGIRVTVPEDDRKLGDALLPALRRRGRVLLVGDPGGGKSTALRSIAAHWAIRSTYPTPVLVDLRHLVARPGQPLDALLDAAVASVLGDERIALRAAMERELGHGRCILLLDGLDEVRRGRKALVSDLARLLRDLNEGVEVVIATRPVAVADARSLGLPQLELHPPDHSGTTINAILRAAAPTVDDESWITTRRQWVDASIERDGDLGRTPLTIVILALIAVRSRDPGELPRSRARLLHRALTDVIERWELAAKRRGDLEIGRLALADARQAIVTTLQVLSSAAIGDDRIDAVQLHENVTSALRRDFSLAPGEARGAADDAIAFWIDTGLFAYDDGSLTATIRQLAELGHAWSAAFGGADVERRAWVADARRSPDLWASLALGAGLAPPIAALWANEVADDGEADELIALIEAVRDGATLSAEMLFTVARAAAARHLTNSRDAERVAEAVLLLPLTHEMRKELRRALMTAAVPADRRTVVDVLRILRWNEGGREADERLREFVRAPAPPEPADLRRPDDAHFIFFPSRDETYFRALEGAMLKVIALSREDAELVSDRFDDGSLEFRSQLEQAFAQAGHADLKDRVNEKLRSSATKSREFYENWDFDASLRAMLGVIAKLASPASLTQIEIRRLDALADLFATASVNWMRPGWQTRRLVAMSGWIRAIAELGGFDLGVLAAQARVLLEDMDGDDGVWHLPFDAGTTREPSQWTCVTDPGRTLSELVSAVGLVPSEASRELRLAIATAPAHDRAVALLEKRLDTVRIWARALAATALLVAESEGEGGATAADERARAWLANPDPMLREAAAVWWALRMPAPHAKGELERCLADPDRNVPNEALRWLSPGVLDDALRRRLEELRSDQPRVWMCCWCGEQNGSDDGSSCRKCRCSQPQIGERITELLDDRSGAPLRIGRSPHRLRRIRY